MILMAQKKSAFDRTKPSDIIDISKLEKETQKLLFVGLIFAFILHPVVGSYFMFKKSDETVAGNYPVKFVFNSARLLKPFELKPKYASKRMLQREKMSYKLPDAQLETRTDPTIEIKENLDNLNIETKIIPENEPDTFYLNDKDTGVPVISESGRQISMKEELISVGDHDTGRYRAMIIQNPDKFDLQGFVYISTTWGSQLKVSDHLKRSIISLTEAVNRYTDIEAKVGSHLLLDSHKLFTTPLVIITTDKAFELTPIERKNFGAYLKAGGFAFIDNGEPVQECSQAESSLRQMLRDTLGKGIKFKPILNDHPLYHCYFDFDDGPPQGSEIQLVQTTTTGIQGATAQNSAMSKTVPYLEGIWIDGRLAVVYSNKGYVLKWSDYGNNEPQLKMGVNMVVYALTHEGGIAQKTMSNYSTVQ